MHISDLKHPDSTLQQKLEYLYNLRTGSKINWDSAAYLELLGKLGNPHKNLPPIIHVAGTNGKGSVIALLRSVFEAADYKVHAYTSPHLISVNERIVLAGQHISDFALNAAIDEVLDNIGDAKLSFFEIMTAIAFKAFAQVPADILLLEVGMGGKLDCTTVIESPLVSIINRISMDHTDFLGQTIAEIAAQKAGIIKQKTPCVVGFQGHGELGRMVCEVIEAQAKSLASPVFFYGDLWRVTKENTGFSFDFEGQTHFFPFPALSGDHQIYNAGLVLAALHIVRHHFDIKVQHIADGFSCVAWAGRLQHLEQTQSTHEIWLDCGHNDSAGEVLAQQATVWKAQDGKSLVLIVGMLGTKDLDSFLSPLLPSCAAVYCVGISGEPNSQRAEFMAQKIEAIAPQCQVSVCADVVSALQNCNEQFSPKDARILIAGSVYLAGEVLRLYSSARI